MLTKHKVFLLLAKWIPVVTAIGILINATLVYFNSPDDVNDLMSFTIGVSIAGIALMYSCSYAFNFCTWHRVVISYNASVMLLTFFIRYTSIECGYSLLLLSYYILAGVFTLIGLYLHNKKILTLLQKMSVLLKVLKKELQHSIENIDAGNSEITEELVELVKLLATINKGGERISKTIACEKILHCSPSTFDNYVREGIIPPGRKVAGFKELSWTESDFIDIKLKRIRNAVK
jgi:hypothetical protein